MTDNLDFDMQAAWLRRFSADADGSLRAFALRLKEALPDLVVLHEQRGLFQRGGKIVGVTVEIGEKRYSLGLERGRLTATVAMEVRGITLNTRRVDPADWFAHLGAETREATDRAKALSQSLHAFMVE